MYLPRPLRGNLSVWEQAREVGKIRGREVSSEKWEPTKRVLEELGRRSASEKGTGKEAAKNLELECLRSSFRLFSGLCSEMTPPSTHGNPTASVIICYTRQPS